MESSGDPGRCVDYSGKGDKVKGEMNNYSEGYWKRYAETLRGIIIIQGIVIGITLLMIVLILVLP